MKVALLCPTSGQTRRGYERFLTDLHRVVKSEIRASLFTGAADGREDTVVVPHIRRTGPTSRLFPERLRYLRYQLEFASFALAVYPSLERGKFDLAHFIDPPLGQWLRHFRRLWHGRFRLLFTDGGPVACDCLRRSDYIHCVTPSAWDSALRSGVPSERLTMLPVGIEPANFQTPCSREQLRRRYGLPEDVFVVLAVTAVNRRHKRVDYLIEETSRVNGNLLLWLDGSLHPDGDPSLLQLGADRLGRRFRYSHVPSEQVCELFRMADVVVSSSLHESFGLAVLEALCCGSAVVTHDSPHFRWLCGSAAHYLDMQGEGNLSAWLTEVLACPAKLRLSPVTANPAGRFEWSSLKPAYLEMYARAAAAALHSN